MLLTWLATLFNCTCEQFYLNNLVCCTHQFELLNIFFIARTFFYDDSLVIQTQVLNRGRMRNNWQLFPFHTICHLANSTALFFSLQHLRCTRDLCAGDKISIFFFLNGSWGSAFNMRIYVKYLNLNKIKDLK